MIDSTPTEVIVTNVSDMDGEDGGSLPLREIWGRVTDLFSSAEPFAETGSGYFDNCDGGLGAFRSDWYKAKSGAQLPFKGRPDAVDIGTKTQVCMHITAATYSTVGYQRRPWAKRLNAGTLPMELTEAFDLATNGVDVTAARMALHARFWKVAYHWVGLLNGDVLYNNQATRYTYHGNGSNSASIGVSAEALLPALERGRKSKHTEVDAAFIETNRRLIREAVTHSRAEGAPIDNITAHRCFSGTRTGDPGESVWREVVKPMASELSLDIDYTLRRSKGRPIPKEWDDDATHNFAGRPVS